MKASRVLAYILAGTALALMGVGCAIAEENKSRVASQGMASAPITQPRQPKPYQASTLKFEKGNPGLSRKDVDNLNKLAQAMREEGNIKGAKVVVWPDKDPKKQKVTRADRDIAMKRASNIQKYLKQEGISQVQVFNMADNKNWLTRNYNRSDQELSATFAKKGAAPVTEKEFKLIKEDGGPSKSVVILERQQPKKNRSQARNQ